MSKYINNIFVFQYERIFFLFLFILLLLLFDQIHFWFIWLYIPSKENFIQNFFLKKTYINGKVSMIDKNLFVLGGNLSVINIYVYWGQVFLIKQKNCEVLDELSNEVQRWNNPHVHMEALRSDRRIYPNIKELYTEMEIMNKWTFLFWCGHYQHFDNLNSIAVWSLFIKEAHIYPFTPACQKLNYSWYKMPMEIRHLM